MYDKNVSRCPRCSGVYDATERVCPVDGEPLVGDDRSAPTAAGFRARPMTPAGDVAAMPKLSEDQSMPGLMEQRLEPGSRVGEYEIAEKLGEGGMGIVYAGVQPIIGKKVAIKLLNVVLSQDPVMVQRFVQEARAVNQIGHHNIVDIFSFGQLPNGRHYYVMEYLQGRSLKLRLQADPPLTYAQAFPILGAVCDALAAAHATGIVHRDLKPDNIYLVERAPSEAPTVKLLDFGIAKLLRRGEDAAHTRTGAPIGTPLYMSPEQCRSKPVEASADLYALGVIMFEMFSGRLPFAGPDYIDIVNGHLMAPPPLPTDFAAAIPVELESLILRCLEKEPDKRPASAAEVAEQLRAIAVTAPPDEPLPVRTVATASTAPQSPAIATPKARSTPARRSAPPVARPPARWPLAAVAIVVAAGATALLWPSRRAPAPPPPIDLEVASDPPGGHIFVDGRARAERTPAHLSLPAAAEIAVRVEHDGYRSRDEVVRPAPGAGRATVSVRLEPLPAGLRIHTNAPQATWRLDDAMLAETAGALTLDQVAPGAHRVRIEARGFEPREEPITVEPGQNVALDWTLQATAVERKRPRPSNALPDAPATDFRAPR